MATYKIEATVAGERIEGVRAKAKEVFGDGVTLVERVKPESRADRFAEAESLASSALSIVEELKDEMESWYDSIPENLQGGDKASEVEQAKAALEEIQSTLEQVEWSVDFPSMM